MNPEYFAAVGLGVLGNWATSLISIVFSKYIGTKNDPLMNKVYSAADKAVDTFFKKYQQSFGKPEESFLARQENWDVILKYLWFGITSLEQTPINPQGFNGAAEASPEAILFFMQSLEAEMRKDNELNNLLEQKKHLSTGEQTYETVKKIDEKISNLNPHLIPKKLTNKVPQTSLDEIVGREDDINKLHESLFNHRKVVLVNGMGGIGKTTLAQVYINKYWEDYNHIAWVSQLTGDFAKDVINTEGLLFNLGIKSDGKTSDELFSEVISELNRIEQNPNLLIIDNADHGLAKYHDNLPDPSLWHVIVTSREKIETFQIQEIEFLSETDAIELFLKHYNVGRIPHECIKNLVNKVDLHTLTIEILAKTAQLQRASIDTLEKAIEEDLRANVYVKHNGDKIERVTSYLCSIFSLSSLSDNELWLLKQFVCLPAEFHKYDLLEELIRPEDYEKEDVFSETLDSLCSKGWLLKNTEKDIYKMHRIIADIAKKQNTITIDEVISLIESITEKLEIDQTRDNPVDKFPWILFGLPILNLFHNSENNKISVLQNNLATVLKDLGDYSGARELLEKAVKSDEKNFGPEHPSSAIRYSNLALVLQALGDYSGARELLEKAMKSNEKNFGPEHPSTAVSYSNLATVLKDLGNYSGARDLLEKAVKSDEKNFGPEHPSTTVSYSNLALVLQDLGDYSGARDLLEKAVKSDEKNFGPEHPSTAVSYSNLALVLQALGDYSGARELLEKAMKSNEKNFGPEHPSTAIRYSNLALVLKDLGDYSGARELLEKAVKSIEKNFGPEHPSTAIRNSNLALVLQDLGDYNGARELLEKAVKSDEKNFGPEHPSTAIRYSNLALVLQDLGDYNGARELLEKAVKSNEKNFGPEHPSTAVSYSNLALVLKALGDYSGARELLEKAVKSNEKNFGPEHPSTAVSYSNLATVLKDLGDYSGARELLEKAVKSDEKNFGPEHPSTAVSFSNLALVLEDLGDYSGARELLEKAVKSNEKNFGPEHPSTAVSYSNLATVLQDLGDYSGARELLEKAVNSNEKNFGPEHPSTAIRYSNLALVLKDLGDYSGARELLEKAVNSNEKNFGPEHPSTAVSYSNLQQCLKILATTAEPANCERKQ